MFQVLGNARGRPLRGYVDLHTHPMSYLGFGAHLVHGAPDIGATIPPGQLYSSEGAIFNGKPNCNPGAVVAASIEQALGSCRATHEGHNADGNNCGDHIRRVVLDQFENGQQANKAHDVDHPDGAPTFTRWPKWNDIEHQQMWVDWIRRAYDGGLRVMVALAVNSYTLGKGIRGNEPLDDKGTGDQQLREMSAMVRRHDFMQVAHSSAELRKIVESDRLAVILGVELDDIGSLVIRPGDAPSVSEVLSEVQRLRDELEVRYVFPVHITDNYFGGTAVYENDFMIANKLQFGSFLDLRCARPADLVTHQMHNDEASPFKSLLAGSGLDVQPIPSCTTGHVNNRGLQPLGRVLIEALKGSGMLIDLDHMSQRTVEETLTAFPYYPFLSGHNGLRVAGGNVDEKTRTATQYRSLATRGSMAGVGFSGATATSFMQSVRRVAELGLPVALGSDINGLVKMPAPPVAGAGSTVSYSASFPSARTGSRVWNYNTEGVAHIGLFPDFLRDVELSGGTDVVTKLFGGAEALAKTWERAEQQNGWHAGDFDGNGATDLITWNDSSKLWNVYLSDGSRFRRENWSGAWGSDGAVQVADFNGDGKSDIVMWRAANNDWTVNLSTATGFDFHVWAGAWGSDGPIQVADFNGDGKSDIMMWRLTNHDWTVNLSTGSGFNFQVWTGAWGSDGPIQVGDFNGDHKADIMMWRAANHDWTVNLSTGSGFSFQVWTGAWGSDGPIQVGDFNGDRKMDVMMWRAANRDWTVNLSTGAGFDFQVWTGASGSDGPIQLGDFNGDHKTDVVMWRPSNRDWTINLSTGRGFSSSVWAGGSGAVGPSRLGDFNKDGKTDIAIRRNASSDWLLNLATGSAFSSPTW